MFAIPPLVQKIAFPVVVVVGRILGKYKRFKDAPEPIRRPALPPPPL